MFRSLSHYVFFLLAGSFICINVAAQDESTDAPVRAITQVAGDVYRFQNNLHVSVFMVTDEGVIASDPIDPEAAAWLNNEIQERFGQPVKYVIYSHDHFDHVSGAAAFEGATIIAHANGRDEIAGSEHPIAMPDIMFSDKLVVELGGKQVELFYLGTSHSDNMIFMRFPEEQVLFVVDVMERQMVPYRDFGSDDIDGILRSLATLEEVDFEILLVGHSIGENHTPVGTVADMVAYREYIMLLRERVEAELAANKSVEEIKAAVTMSEYDHWVAYDIWQALNVEGMVRYIQDGRL